ncbi:MAG: hypothetical protein KJ000_22280 [Pirellulaceae bacterium]|nr:hypothetical protein [Pirellulaceae bacterium]
MKVRMQSRRSNCAAVIAMLLPGIGLAADEVPAELDYSVSWIGNTFSGGDAGWVPQDVQDIFVTPDGTVYTTVGWEEHRGNIAAFQDGRLSQQTAHWKSGGIDRLVGDTITANTQHIFYATGTPDGHDGRVKGTFLARRDRAEIANRRRERRVEVGPVVVGVAASDERVYAACADGRVRVFDTDLNPLGDWAAPSPCEMALDAAGNLWIIDTADHVVRRFDPTGRPLPQVLRFPPGVEPADVAVKAEGQLLVADRGKNRQVLVYRNLDTKPELERVLGEPGGIFAGETAGRWGDQRFIAPIGVGSDADGNLYVACGPYAGTHGGTAVIRSFTPVGRLNWSVLSTEWLDTVDVDGASNGSVLYGSKYRYSLDLNKPPGQQWTVQAITLDPDKYPDDPRLKSAAIGGVWHRWIDNRNYLYFPDMNGGNLFVYRLDPQREGEIAVFCAQISTKDLWVDTDGDGRRDETEVTANPTGESRGWYVEPNGTVWQATRRNGIFAYPIDRVLANGVPVYSVATRKTWAAPTPFTELRRIVYDRDHDVMYLAGSTGDAQAEHWKPMGPNLIRFDRWSTEPTVAWHLVLLHEKGRGGHESHEPFDFAVEGDYVFVVYAGRLPSRNLPTGTVMVFEKRNGNYVGHFQPTGTRTGAVPMDALQDMVHSINVFRRDDGEYLVFIEDDGYTKNVLYRWKPQPPSNEDGGTQNDSPVSTTRHFAVTQQVP